MENVLTKPRAVLLYRASSKKQTDSDNDIPLQRNILKPWAEQKGWKFEKEFVEGGISGFKVSASKRDAIIEIKKMAERREFDILGIYMSDRLGRIAEETPLIVSFLNARGIKVISYCEGEINSSTHSDKLMTYIRYWQAEGESLKTSARVCDAVLENVNKGRWRGGPPPYGYKSVSRGTLNYKGKPILDVEIDPVTSEHVKTIFELYTKDHYGTRLVAKYLNDRDIKTPTGVLWNSSLISKLLRCKTYIGIYELHKLVKKPIVESPVMPNLIIIDEGTFYKAQELLKQNSTGERRPPTRHGERLLTGLLYCGQCGNKITSFYSYHTADSVKPKDERRKQFYYRCVTDQKPRSDILKCKPSMWSVKIMDETIIRYAKKFVLEIDKERLLADHENDIKSKMDEAVKRVEKAESELNKNEREIKKLKDEIMRAILGESAFPQNTLSDMLKAKEKESAEHAKMYEDAQNYIMELDQEYSLKKTVCGEFNSWGERFDAASTADKKSMLLNIIDKIDLYGDSISIQFKVELYPLSNLRVAEPSQFVSETYNDNNNDYPPSQTKKRCPSRLRSSMITQTVSYENGYILSKKQPKRSLLEKVDESGLTVEERLINYCKTPKLKKEINTMLGMSVKSCTWVWQKYLLPLIKCGKLKMTIPNNRASKNQRFISGDVATATEEEMLKFCYEPKSRTEIKECFKLTYWTAWTHIKPLVDNGKLKPTIPSIGATSPRQKYTSQEVNAAKLTDETLKKLCITPRTRAEIIAHFNLETQYGRRLIASKVKEGVILRTNPDKPESPNQRFIGIKI